MPVRFVDTCVCVRPPMTAVSPSATSTSLCDSRLLVLGPAALMLTSCSCVASTIRLTWRLAVTRGVTLSLMPISCCEICGATEFNWPAGTGGVSRNEILEPEKSVASLLSSVVVLGSACTSVSASSDKASRNDVRLNPPMAML